VCFRRGAGLLRSRARPPADLWLAAPLAGGGLRLILGGEWFALDAGFRVGVWLGLLPAMSYAGYLLSMRRAGRDARDPLPAAEIAVVSLLVALLLGAAGLAEGSSLAVPTLMDFGWLLAYGMLAHAAGLMLIASSLTAVTAAETGIALLLQPSLSLLWDVLLFGRALDAVEWIGVAITLAAIALGSQRRIHRV
jgi:drug/metabolite transporter (DMT)-like permease